jgi:hypothetical protein
MQSPEWLRYQSKTRVIAGLLIVGVTLYFVIGNPRGAKYNIAVEQEIKLARKICENGADWVLENLSDMKLGEATLDHIQVDGKAPELKHLRYPEVLFFDTGFRHSGQQAEINCTFSDPRSFSTHYYYDIRHRIWVDKARTRR